MSTYTTQAMSERMDTSVRLDQRQSTNPKAILEDLFELLEDYGPAWYTEEHHNRAVAALLDRVS